MGFDPTTVANGTLAKRGLLGAIGWWGGTPPYPGLMPIMGGVLGDRYLLGVNKE
ncbi:MAG: hypothetical protein AAFQ60_15800 [Pseudomonadota bacterium]